MTDWSDKQDVLKAVKQDGRALEYASEELQADKEVVLEAVKQKGGALEYASEELRADPEVYLTAIAQDPEAAGHAIFNKEKAAELLGMWQGVQPDKTVSTSGASVDKARKSPGAFIA